MNESGSTDAIGMSVINGCLVVPVQTELYEDALLAIQRGILETIHRSEVNRGVIDLSAVPVIDSFAFQTLTNTLRMVALQGATFVLAGLQPGVVSALVELDVDTSGIRTALNLDDAFDMLRATAPDIEEHEVADESDPCDLEETEGGDGDIASGDANGADSNGR